MKHEELSKAVAAEEAKAGELNACRHAVLTALGQAEPELARHILGLFSNPESAARWVCADLRGLQSSPARAVAEGRVADVLAIVQSAAYGFSA